MAMSSMYEDGDANAPNPWPVRLVIRMGLSKDAKHAERLLLVFVAFALAAAAWIIFGGSSAQPDPSGAPNPAAEYSQR